jgi:hypothetical protein
MSGLSTGAKEKIRAKVNYALGMIAAEIRHDVDEGLVAGQAIAVQLSAELISEVERDMKPEGSWPGGL